MTGFRKVGERSVHEGRVVSLGVATFESPDGSRFDRDVVHHPGAVAVVPLLDDGTVVLVHQYRPPLDEAILEIPAGLRDVDGEAPEVTAARELAEEVGLAPGHLEPLVRFHNSPGCSDEAVWVYLATELTEAPHDPQGIEEQHMQTRAVPLDAVPAMVASGEITDAKTIIGLTLTLARRG